ncbi:MAG TPA: asparagine synthase (glutamine-hydrolyzing) [Bacteroidia bacterium]|jgi:asparagine synthase (glutamine-hydrolysing)|nr:asparagine synthase (glutamine-hydrolyzing) [Bacteroidia bacterium]
MCGIAGIVSKENLSPTGLHKMSATLKHRGPDDEGFTLFSKGGQTKNFRGEDTIAELQNFEHISAAKPDYTLGLMHRRLSIIDLSVNGHQPMHFQDKYTLVFNGEIYNYPEIRTELQKEGYTFQTTGDTEVIMAAYHKYGAACVEKFIGMWAFAIFDKEKNMLFLSRDRFGIKPLYYYEDGNKFAFASEIKALLALDFIEPTAKLSSAFEYISFGATFSPVDAIFSQIKTLEPANNLVLNTNSLQSTVSCYYNLKDKVLNYILPPDEKILDTFTSLLNNAINIHLRSDVAVGSTLSGGLDSSTLVALASTKMHGKTFKTFTASYNEPGIDESSFAKMVTNAIPNLEPHYIYPQIKDYWNDFEKLTLHQDLPISSTSMFAQWEVMKRAKQENIKVLLDGQGADEILGGYYNFAGIYLIELLKGFRVRSYFSEKKSLETNFVPDMNTALGRAFFYFMPDFIQRKIRAGKRLGMGFISDKYKPEMNRVQIPGRGGKSFKEQSFLSMQYGLQDLLRYEDRNSMAFSIESRVPFLDHRIVEFCITLKNDWKIHEGWTKYILRKAAEPVLNPEVSWRKDKMGFVTPQKTWKENSKKELTDFVNNCKAPDFINKKYLVNLCSEEISNATHLSEFWRMISFLKWVQVFKVRFE